MDRDRISSGRPGYSLGRAAGCHRRMRRRLLNEQVRCAGRERRRRHARTALQAVTEEGRPGRSKPPLTPATPYRHVPGARFAKGCR